MRLKFMHGDTVDPYWVGSPRKSVFNQIKDLRQNNNSLNK